MSPAADCLGADELAAMADGSLAPDRADAVIGHVDACAACAEVVAAMGAFEGEPRAVGRYRIEHVLGAGGMGIVHAAWDPELRRRVAVKLVHPDNTEDAARTRMLREARALARINHPNVVAVHDVGEHEDGVYVATELVDGETLATWCLGRTPAEIVGAWIQVARGLAAAHAEAVVHRDVKPSNALVSRDGRVRIGDFGLARRTGAAGPDDAADRARSPMVGAASPAGDPSVDSRVTGTGSVAGTPAYMAPEQRTGSVDARSDQYALSVALTEALTGKRPAADAAPPVSPPALEATLARGLRRDPAERFPSMTALADALAAAIAPAAAPRRRWPAVAAASAAVVAVAAAALIAWRAGPAESEPCRVAALPAALWSPARRAALGAKLPPGIPVRIDRWLAGWTAASTDVCAADGGDPIVRARRQRCLADTLGAMEQLLGRWSESPPENSIYAHDAVDQQPRPARCSRASALAAAGPTDEQAGRLAPLHRAMRGRGTSGAIDEARGWVDQARAIGYAPAVVDAMSIVAGRQAGSDIPAAIDTLRAAHALAARARDGWSEVTAAQKLLALLGADATDEADRLAEGARARLAALGGDPALEAAIDYGLGNVWRAARRHDEALAALERSRRGFRAAYGEGDLHEALALIALGGVLLDRDPDSERGRASLKSASDLFDAAGMPMPISIPRDPEALIAQTQQLLALATAAGPNTEAVMDATYNLALAHALADRSQLALEHYRKVVVLGERLGIRNARIAESLGQAAAILVELGRAADAVPVARRAASVAEELGLESELGSNLTVLGSALLDDGQIAEAREPLRRALSIRERLRESGRFRGYTRFLLARAVWGADRARARQLALAARTDLQGFLEGLAADDPNGAYLEKMQRGRLDAIDEWLRTHR